MLRRKSDCRGGLCVHAAPRFGDGIANELEGQTGIGVDKIDTNGFSVDDRQRMTQFVADRTAVSGFEQSFDKGKVEIVLPVARAFESLAPYSTDDRAKNRSVWRGPLVLAAEVRLYLQGARFEDRPAKIVRLLVFHNGSIQADLQVRRSHFADHSQHVVVGPYDGLVILQRERDALLAGDAGRLHQAVSAVVPGLLFRNILMHLVPSALGQIVAPAALGSAMCAGPAHLGPGA